MENLCEFTNDRRKLYTADVVVFQEKDIFNIPERNNSKQVTKQLNLQHEYTVIRHILL